MVKLAPHIKYVMEKFKTKLPKEDLKRFAKEVSLPTYDWPTISAERC